MIFEEKKIVLKNGKEAILRSPTASDSLQVIDYFKKASGETEYLIRYPEEITFTEEEEIEILNISRESDTQMMIACEFDGKIVGMCSIVFNNKIKTKHRASMAIALLKNYWGLSIGSQMIGELIKEAKKRKVSQLELDYIEGNDRARALYEKMGFVEVGIKPNSIKLKDGKLLDEISMINILD